MGLPPVGLGSELQYAGSEGKKGHKFTAIKSGMIQSQHSDYDFKKKKRFFERMIIKFNIYISDESKKSRGICLHLLYVLQ